AQLQAALEHGREALREETVLRARDGTPIPVSLTTSLLRNERRNVYGAIATFVDLSPLKRAEDQARQLDRLAALGRFTSSVAHEIRNPLTGIAAGVQYLSRGLAEDGPARDRAGRGDSGRGSRRGYSAREPEDPVRAVLHHQARRDRARPLHQPRHRDAPRRRADHSEPAREGHCVHTRAAARSAGRKPMS